MGRAVLGEAIRPRRPFECHGSEHACHRVIEMRGHAAVRAKGDHDLRANFADMLHQISGDSEQISAVQLCILIAQHLEARHAEHLAGRSKLVRAHFCQFFFGLRGATVAGRCARRETNHAGLNATLAIQGQRTAEGASFIVRMGSDAKKLEHFD